MGLEVRKGDLICNKCRKHGNELLHKANDEENCNDFQETAAPLTDDTGEDNAVGASENCTVGKNDYEIMFEKLKKNFSECDKNDPLKVQILTLVPDDWTLQKIADEFNTTMWLARKARDLLKNEGVFGKVKPNQGKNLSPEIEKKIKDFYNSDEISRMMPSIKDTVTMKVDGVKTKVQKRILLLSLKELYKSFKQENTTITLGFSTFAKHRPKNCILPGQSGAHSVCVCTIHQNVKTMLDAIDLQKLTTNEPIMLSSYKDCLKQLVCSGPTEKCFLNEC